MASEEVEIQKTVEESRSEIKFEEKGTEKTDVTVTTVEQTDVTITFEQLDRAAVEAMTEAADNILNSVVATAGTGNADTENLAGDVVLNLEVDGAPNSLRLLDEIPLAEPGTGEGRAETIEGNKEGASEMEATGGNTNDGHVATTVPQSDNVPDTVDAMAVEGLSTDVLPEQTIKLEHKFGVGDSVEGFSAEDGLEGAWFKGVIKEISGENALVQFEDLLDDNEKDKLEEWYPLSHEGTITLSPDGKPISKDDAPKEGEEEVSKTLRRKLRPASSLEPFETAGKKNPKGKKSEPSKLSTGDQIEARYDDAWWEAVVVSLKGKNIHVFYPGNKDAGIVKPTAARPQLIYEDGFWVVNKQKSTLDLPSVKEPAKRKSKAVTPRKSTGIAEKLTKKPGKNPAKSPQKKSAAATSKGAAKRGVKVSKSPKVSPSLKRKAGAQPAREATKKVKSLGKITAGDNSQTKKKTTPAKRVKQAEPKPAKAEKAKIEKPKAVPKAKKVEPVTKPPKQTKAPAKPKAKPEKKEAKSPVVKPARVAAKPKPASAEKGQKSNKSAETKPRTRLPVKVAATPKKGRKGAANEKAADIPDTPTSTRSTRSKGPAPNPAEAVQLALAETNSPLHSPLGKVSSGGSAASKKPVGRGAKGKKGEVSANEGMVSMNGDNSNKVTTMVFETRVTRGHVTVTESPSNNKASSKRKLEKNEEDAPPAKKRGRAVKKDSAAEEKAAPASPLPAAAKGRGRGSAKGKEQAVAATPSRATRGSKMSPTKAEKPKAPASGEKRKRGRK